MALYHRHRPQTFASVIGQDHIIQAITNQIIHGKVGHAYLFSGPRGVGKTTTARLLAQAVTCSRKNAKSAEPDADSSEVQEIRAGRSIDIIEIDAASHTGVDTVREHIIENAQWKPTKLPYKIFIIDEVHMLSTSAFNALLKTLEEPPAHVIFILATTELHKLPETIISRCQHFQFHTVPHPVIKDHLAHIAKEEGIRVDDPVLGRVVAKSGGCVRDAVNLLEQVMATGEKHITLEMSSMLLPTGAEGHAIRFIKALTEKQTGEALRLIQEIREQGISLSQLFDDIVSQLRAVLLLQHHAPAQGQIEELQDLVNAISPAELVQLIDTVLKRRAMLKQMPLAELALELLAVEWCDRGGTKPTEKPKGAIKENTDIKNYWPAFLAAVEAHSPSLVFLLKMSEIIGVTGNTVMLGVEFPFHKDKLLDPPCKRQLENLYSELVGSPILLDVSVTTSPQKPSSIAMHDLAAAFGGEVVG